MIGRPRKGASLFLRMLLIILACVAGIQFLNFAIALLVGPPLPRVHTINQVAMALSGAAAQRGENDIRVFREAEPDATDSPEALSLRRTIAHTLSVDEDRIRVWIPTAPRILSSLRIVAGRDFDRTDIKKRVLLGTFVVSIRDSDGRWLSARPAITGFERWRFGVLAWLLSNLMVVAALAWVLARRTARPIAMFATAAERLGRDPRGAPVPVSGPPELAYAAEAFNEMQRRLNRYVEDRTTMIAAIAHDLRTPLMRLSLQMDRLPEGHRLAGERAIAEMEAMIAAATAYVRNASWKSERRQLDLRSLVDCVVDDYVDRGEPVTVVPGPAPVIFGDDMALRAILNNLIGNALRYGGDAAVSIEADDSEVTLHVRDHGAGIGSDDLERVFEPFFRAERSRNQDTGGHGLGLASVRAMTRAHGGDVTLVNHPDGGVLASVVLPI